MNKPAILCPRALTIVTLPLVSLSLSPQLLSSLMIVLFPAMIHLIALLVRIV